jgi:hypothetical protein
LSSALAACERARSKTAATDAPDRRKAQLRRERERLV